MSDQEKTGDAKASPGSGGNGRAEPKQGGLAGDRLNDLLLAIVEREIGKGEPARAEDWAALRGLAEGNAGGTELVTTLEGVIHRCNDEMKARFEAHGTDLTRLRESVVTLIRVSIMKKLGLTESSTKES